MNLRDIVELNQGELIKASAQNMLSSELTSYCRVMISYLRGEVSGIEKELATTQLSSDLKMLAQIRLEILKGIDLIPALHELQQNLGKINDSLTQAEAMFCLVIGNLKVGSYQLASQYSLHAEVEYEKNRCFKKATKCFLNYIVAQSHLFPESRLFTEYHTLLKKAEACQEWGAASIAELNISRELQKVGALELSLKSAYSAIQFAEKMAFGSREHGFALLQASSSLLDLKRSLEAEHFLGLASLVDHPEIIASCEIMRSRILDLPINKSTTEPHLMKRWEEIPTAKEKFLGPMESKLVENLKSSPKSFNQLTEILFNDVVDAFSQRERLKNLFSRVRKKHPGLIVYETGLYFLSDIQIPMTEKEKVSR